MPNKILSQKLLDVFFWLISFIIMIFLVVYQRTTGPTYPMKVSISIDGQTYKGKLIRSWDKATPAKIEIPFTSIHIEAYLVYKRYKSYDNWDTVKMDVSEGKFTGYLPQLPPAGKIIYHVLLYDKNNQQFITFNEKPAILRYRGAVPLSIVIPHILLMFIAVTAAVRTGLEALFLRQRIYTFTFLTIVSLFIGGFIFGPLMQKYAFGAYWTGFPFGHDLTDNKTLVAFIFWLIAFIVVRKKPQNRFWPLLATIILIATYLIPHSLMGSEIDFTATETQQYTTE